MSNTFLLICGKILPNGLFIFPNAIVSIDSFHVIQVIERYVDKIRISIMNKYDKRSNQYYLLKEFG